MNAVEAQAWMEFTKSSIHHWTVDPIHNGKGRNLLVYIGGESGKYLSIMKKDGEAVLEIGTYEDAIPHIAEAIFTSKVKKEFASMGDAEKCITMILEDIEYDRTMPILANVLLRKLVRKMV